VTAGRSATDKGQVAHEGRTLNKVSRLRSSSRIRGALIADANGLEAVDASNEESTTTAGHSIFPAAFKASSKGSPTATETFVQPSVTRTATENCVAKERANSKACAKGVWPPVGRKSRARRAAFASRQGARTTSAFAPRNETLRPHLSYRRRIRAARQRRRLCFAKMHPMRSQGTSALT
jgi:hypothetical protein